MHCNSRWCPLVVADSNSRALADSTATFKTNADRSSRLAAACGTRLVAQIVFRLNELDRAS